MKKIKSLVIGALCVLPAQLVWAGDVLSFRTACKSIFTDSASTRQVTTLETKATPQERAVQAEIKKAEDQVYQIYSKGFVGMFEDILFRAGTGKFDAAVSTGRPWSDPTLFVRTVSKKTKDKNFGFHQILRQGGQRKRWLYSGFTQSILGLREIDSFASDFDRKSTSNIKEIIVASDKSVEELIEFYGSTDFHHAPSNRYQAKVLNATDIQRQSTASSSAGDMNVYHTQWSPADTLSTSELIQQREGQINVVTDVHGRATTSPNLSAVLSSYHQVLADTGYLILRLPVHGLFAHDGGVSPDFRYQRFMVKTKDRVKEVEPDVFFSLLPGFEFINGWKSHMDLEMDPTLNDHSQRAIKKISAYPMRNEYFTAVLKKRPGVSARSAPIRVTVKLDPTNRPTRILEIDGLHGTF